MTLSEWAYNTLIHAGLPAAVAGAYLAFQGRNPGHQTSRKFSVPSEEFLDDDCRLWVHGASVGEAGVVNKILALAGEIGLSNDEIVVSTQTESGLETVDHDRGFLLPADYPSLVGPLSKRIDADCLAVVETEIWPNLYRYHSGRVRLLNGRISDSAYQSYRWIKPLLGSALRHVAGVYARSERDRERFADLAPDLDHLETTGDLKWTRCLNPPEDSVRIPWGEDRTIVTAGSTHPGEEEMLLKTLQELDYRVVLAPRHLDRLEAVEHLLEDRGLRWVNYSELPADDSDPEVLLVDEFGLLEGFYRESDLAVVGGSWRTDGGHNLLEAAQYGVPVLTGPRHQNFREMAELLGGVGLLEIVEEEDLGTSIRNFENRMDSERAVRKLHDEIRPIEERYKAILNDAVGGETVAGVNNNG